MLVEQEILRYLCMLVYEDLKAVERIRIEEKIKMIRRLDQSSTRLSINA